MTEPKKLGKYEIRRELGQGAMGIVYEGFDPIRCWASKGTSSF